MKWFIAATMALALVCTTGAFAQDDFDLDSLFDDAPASAESADAGFDDLFSDADAAVAEPVAEVAEAADDVVADVADVAEDVAAAAEDEAPLFDDFAADSAAVADDFAAAAEPVAADFTEDVAEAADDFAAASDDFAAAADDFSSASDDLFGDASDDVPAVAEVADDFTDDFEDDFGSMDAVADDDDFAFAADDVVEEVIEDDIPAASQVAEDKRIDSKEAKRIAKEVSKLEEVRRQAAESDADALAQDGFRALEAGRFAAAATAFGSALEKMPVREQTAESRTRIAWGLAEAKFHQASALMEDEATLPDARTAVEDGLVADPSHLGLQRLAAKLEKLEAKAALPKRPADQAGTIARANDIKALYSEAKQWYSLKDYDRAMPLFQKILEIDPYNRSAIRYMRQIEIRKHKVADLSYDATREGMLARVRESWTPPNRHHIEIPGDADTQGKSSTKARSSVLTDRMKNIVIPKLVFRQANIADVVNYLVQASEAADPNGEGINIILNLGDASSVPAASAPAASSGFDDDDWGMGGDDFGASAPMDMGGGSSVQPITLNLRNVTMADAIQFITEVAQLKYRVEDAAVIITRKDAPVGTIITRMYSVQPSFMNVVQEPVDTGDSGGEFTPMGLGADMTLRRGDVKDFFEKCGVQFPTGASITYNPTISQLIVANTAENLEAFERILQQINIVPNQVEIEARFIEINQTDLEELGLQWALNNTWQLGHKKDGSGGAIQMNADTKGITQGNRYFVYDSQKNIIDRTSDALFDSINQTPLGQIASFSSVLTNPELTVTLQALSQHGASDLLSAPKVTTRSGAPAMIQVVREIRYPNDYDLTQPTTDSDGNVTMGPVVQPTDFQMRPTGVLLNVTPTVGPDGYTIDLILEPEVCELVEWIDYGSSFSVQTGGGAMATRDSQTQEYHFKMDQPVFSSSKVNTSLVIWDSQTVVMGGLIREEVVTFKDKIPILGDIPLLGWLFRTEGEQSVKKNLLIFVTARLVDPAGRPVHGDNAVLPGAGIDTSPTEE